MQPIEQLFYSIIFFEQLLFHSASSRHTCLLVLANQLQHAAQQRIQHRGILLRKARHACGKQGVHRGFQAAISHKSNCASCCRCTVLDKKQKQSQSRLGLVRQQSILPAGNTHQVWRSCGPAQNAAAPQATAAPRLQAGKQACHSKLAREASQQVEQKCWHPNRSPNATQRQCI